MQPILIRKEYQSSMVSVLPYNNKRIATRVITIGLLSRCYFFCENTLTSTVLVQYHHLPQPYLQIPSRELLRRICVFLTWCEISPLDVSDLTNWCRYSQSCHKLSKLNLSLAEAHGGLQEVLWHNRYPPPEQCMALIVLYWYCANETA